MNLLAVAEKLVQKTYMQTHKAHTCTHTHTHTHTEDDYCMRMPPGLRPQGITIGIYVAACAYNVHVCVHVCGVISA